MSVVDVEEVEVEVEVVGEADWERKLEWSRRGRGRELNSGRGSRTSLMDLGIRSATSHMPI